MRKNEKLEKALSARKNLIERIIAENERSIASESFPTTYAVKHGKRYQYYFNDEKVKGKRKYIPVALHDEVKQRIQQEYEEKVIKVAQSELKNINKLLAVYENGLAEDVYKKMPAGKQIMISPISVDDEQFIDNWRRQKYEKKEFRDGDAEYYSGRDERMRSKSEVIIANMLDKLGIPYLYEKPLFLKGFGIVYPDFTLLDIYTRREVYLEHLGMLGNIEYVNKSISKIRLYEKNGYYIGTDIIITGETVNVPLDIKAVEQRIRKRMNI